MSEGKWTPGAYLREGSFVYALTQYGWDNGEPLMVNRMDARATVYISSGLPQKEREAEARAVAQLFTAAPDLYEALSAVHKLIVQAAETGFNCDDGDWAERLFASQQETYAALARARGESPGESK